MLHLHAVFPADPVDAVEPRLHAGEEGHVPSEGAQPVPGEVGLAVGHLLHQVHVRQHAVHLVVQRKVSAQAPEAIGLHVDARQERIFLHVLGRKGLVEIIDQRDDGQGHGAPPFVRGQKAIQARQALVRLPRPQKSKSGVYSPTLGSSVAAAAGSGVGSAAYWVGGVGVGWALEVRGASSA